MAKKEKKTLLLRLGIRKFEELPMPLGGKIYLTLYWWAWKIFGPGHDWSTYEGTVKALNTPIKTMAWLFANIKYATDKSPEDSWQEAKRTWKRGRGDCEDWAIIANECLKGKYDCVFICMYTKDSGHCELLVDDGKNGKKKKWISVGTFGYNHHEGKSYRDIISDWNGYEDWTSFTIKDEEIKTVENGKRR